MTALRASVSADIYIYAIASPAYQSCMLLYVFISGPVHAIVIYTRMSCVNIYPALRAGFGTLRIYTLSASNILQSMTILLASTLLNLSYLSLDEQQARKAHSRTRMHA